jgi:hypothetical protein
MRTPPTDVRPALWLLKLGALLNGYLLFRLISLSNPDLHGVVPRVLLLAVSGFR